VERVKGVVVAVITPFTSNGVLDEKALARHVSYLVERGVNGLFVLGTTGLGPALSLDEKMKVVDVVVDVVSNSVPVIAHVTDIVFPNMLKLVNYASKADVDAISITAPYFYNGVDELALYEFFERVVESGVSVYLYNQPKYTGLRIPVEVVSRLCSSHENVRGVKDSGGIQQLYEYIVGLRKACGQSFNILTGGDSLFYPALKLGADGIVSSLANIVPDLFIGLYRSFVAGDSSRALEIQERITRLRTVLKKYSQLSAYYKAGELMGLHVGYPRLPIRKLGGGEAAELETALRKQGFLSK